MCRLLSLVLIFFNFSFSQQHSRPKNIVIMIGDGMGLTEVSASVLSMENSPYKKFSNVGLSVTCSLDKLITDSGAGGTAIATGYRTNYHFIAVDTLNRPLTTILEHAKKLKKYTGVVVTSSVTNATPATFLAHIIDRSLDNEIAEQLTNQDVDVVIGGGTQYFLPKEFGGIRTDTLNLLNKILSKGYKLYTNPDSLLNSETGTRFYGLFGSECFPPASQRKYTLAQMVKKAIKELSKNKNGFVLMVEGSQIDWTSHDNNAVEFFPEMVDFNDAINTTLEFADKDKNTLVVVTADHETGGMAIIKGDRDGKNLKFAYTTKGHTPAMVGVFANGKGANLFNGVFDNYMTGRKLFNLLDPKYKFK
ncbi:MAG: alkaline phosphatase [Bacteroidota bacterium]|nr:alkaline phosphatase [Bacteroidota bacterium]